MVTSAKGQSKKPRMSVSTSRPFGDFTNYNPDRVGLEISTSTSHEDSSQFQGLDSRILLPQAKDMSLPTLPNGFVDSQDPDHGALVSIHLKEDGSFRYETTSLIQHRLREVFDERFERRLWRILHESTTSAIEQKEPRRPLRDRRCGGESSHPIRAPRRPGYPRGSYPSLHERKRRAASRPRLSSQQDSESQEGEFDDEDDLQTVKPQKTQRIKVGDEGACIEFYKQRFHLIQQVPCKMIAKDWIRAIEPKKQTQYPYNGGKAAKDAKEKRERSGTAGSWDPENDGNYSKPPWWPDQVKHKEPDHIKKKERVSLLIHLLRNLYDEPSQVRVSTLKASTKRTMAGFPEIKGGPGGEMLEKWLNEIYELREKEEQFKEGGIDASASVSFPEPIIEPRRTPKRNRLSLNNKDRYTPSDLSDNGISGNESQDNSHDIYSPQSDVVPTRGASFGNGIPITHQDSFVHSPPGDQMIQCQNNYRGFPVSGSLSESLSEVQLPGNLLPLPAPSSEPPSILGIATDQWICRTQDNPQEDFSLSPRNRQLQQVRSLQINEPQRPIAPSADMVGIIHPSQHPYRNNSLPNMPSHENWPPQDYFPPPQGMDFSVNRQDTTEIPQSLFVDERRFTPFYDPRVESERSSIQYQMAISTATDSQMHHAESHLHPNGHLQLDRNSHGLSWSPVSFDNSRCG